MMAEDFQNLNFWNCYYNGKFIYWDWHIHSKKILSVLFSMHAIWIVIHRTKYSKYKRNVSTIRTFKKNLGLQHFHIKSWCFSRLKLMKLSVNFQFNRWDGASGEESACRCRRQGCGLHPQVGKIPLQGDDNPLQDSCQRTLSQKRLMD